MSYLPPRRRMACSTSGLLLGLLLTGVTQRALAQSAEDTPPAPPAAETAETTQAAAEGEAATSPPPVEGALPVDTMNIPKGETSSPGGPGSPGSGYLLPGSTVIGSTDNEWVLPGAGYYLGTDAIRTQSYDDINRVLRQVPGVYVREEDGYGLFPNISLRGVDPGRAAKLTIMEDGVLTAPAPYSDPAAYYSPTVGRMHAIEILMGSSQVRYGPHITGGVINYVSTPIPTSTYAYTKALYGSDNEVKVHGYFGDTINLEKHGKIGFVIEGYVHRTDGFKDFSPTTPDLGDPDTGFTRSEPMLKFMWEPDGTVYSRLEFKIGYTDQDADETYLGLSEKDFNRDPFKRYPASRYDNIKSNQTRTFLRWYVEPTDQFNFTTTLYYNKFHRNWYKLNDLRNVDTDGDGIGNGANTGMSEALAGSLGGAGLEVLKGERAGTLRVRANNRDYYGWGSENVASFLFGTGALDHTLSVGLRYHYDQADRFQWDDLYTQNSDGVITGVVRGTKGSQDNRRQETGAVSFFVQDEIKVDKFTFTPGVRYEHLELDYENFNTDASGSGNLDLAGGGIGLTYEVNDQFALFTGGFRGYSPPGPQAKLLDGLSEETSLSAEAGARFRSPTGGFQLQGTFFYTLFEDLIVDQLIGATGAEGSPENIGEIDVYGFELLAKYDPGVEHAWNFKNPWWVAFTYTNATLGTDSNSANPESIFSGGEKGNEVPYIPEFQVNFGTGIEIDKWGVFAIASWVDECFATASNTDKQLNARGNPDARFGTLDSHFTVDLSAYYQIHKHAKILGGVYNLFDEEYIASRLPAGPRPGLGQTFYIGAELQF